MATSAPTPDPFEDRRSSPRVAVAMPAFLQADGQRASVHLLDLSAGGAKLKCPSVPAVGTAVVLDCGSICRSAVVRWSEGPVMGIAFDSELDAREITALIARSVALDERIKAASTRAMGD